MDCSLVALPCHTGIGSWSGRGEVVTPVSGGRVLPSQLTFSSRQSRRSSP